MDVSIQERLDKMKVICEEKISKREDLLLRVTSNNEKIRCKEKRNNDLVIETTRISLTLAEMKSTTGMASQIKHFT